MACTHVQSVKGDWSSGSTWTATITPTSGNLLIVGLQFIANNAGNDCSAAPSDGTNTYTQIDSVAEVLGGINSRQSTFYAKNITGGALTITMTASSSIIYKARIVVHEVAGADTTAPLDGTNHAMSRQSGLGGGTDAYTSGAKTPSANGAYIFGFGGVVGNDDSFTLGTGFTAGPTFGQDCASEYKEQATAASIAATFTLGGGAGVYETAIAVFIPAAGGGFTAKNRRTLGQRVGSRSS